MNEKISKMGVFGWTGLVFDEFFYILCTGRNDQVVRLFASILQ